MLQSDNGKEFIAEVIAILSSICSFALINGSPYTPNEQGSVERRNGTFKVAMAKALAENNNRWIDVADNVCTTYNLTVNAAHNQIPFEVISRKFRGNFVNWNFGENSITAVPVFTPNCKRKFLWKFSLYFS